MSTYVVPQVQVFQEFTSTPAAVTNPLYALIFGPNYSVKRYANGEGLLGQYDPSTDTDYSWPDRPAGGVVDQDWTKVYVEDALLRYYSNLSGQEDDEIKTVIGYNNRIRAEDVNFKDNGTSYPRSSALPQRDVAIGDIARIWANVDSQLVELWTRVTGIVADQSDPVVPSSATADVDNSDLTGGN
ncbi:MAG: hypothetical protein DRP45_12435, partial [Candidatus Zixiibacteriota bacterium]